MNMQRKDLHNLARFGANVVAEVDSMEPVSVRELVATMVRVLDQPNARVVGAVLQALDVASKTLGDGEQLCVTGTDVPPSRPGLLRLGYLCQRLAERRSGAVQANLLELSRSVSEALEDTAPRHGKEPLPLSGRLRRSDLRREQDELMRRWGVTSRPNVWENYVHESPAQHEA
jgi:hypothetical protein